MCSRADDVQDPWVDERDWNAIFPPGLIVPEFDAVLCAGEPVEMVGRRRSESNSPADEVGVFIFNARVACRAPFDDQNLATCIFTPTEESVGEASLEFGRSSGTTISVMSMIFVQVVSCGDEGTDTGEP